MHYVRTIFFFLSFFIPALAYAHVKWFVPENPDPSPTFHITDPGVLAWIAIAIAVIAVGILIERNGPTLPARFAEWLHKKEPHALSIFGIATGVALIISSALGYVFAPNLELVGVLGNSMLIAQALIGAALILGVFVRIAGFLLGALYLVAVYAFGTLELADALAVLGISLFLLISGRPKWRISKWKPIDTWTQKYHPYAIPVLRVFTGLNLVVLGLSEKILQPELAHAFLAAHDWNFMQMLGLSWYSDHLFVLSAGFVEALLGLVFLLGIVTRLNTIVLAGFFTASLILMGPTEVYGHLMHFAIVFILLVFGGGQKWRPFSRLKSTAEAFR